MFNVIKIGNKSEIEAVITKKNRIQANVARMNAARQEKKERKLHEVEVIKNFYEMGRKVTFGPRTQVVSEFEAIRIH